MAKNDKPLVLVADDEPSTLALVANHLKSRGYRVIEATDGDEAWNAACRELPDVVVLDVMMPGMSGWEVCRKIREAVSLAHTGVVMLTGIGDTLNELTSPLYGADAYLDKPFQFTKLAELVESTLAQRTGGKLGRPKKTSGPATRLWKTSLDEEEEPRSERRPKTEKTADEADESFVKPAKKAAKKAQKKAPAKKTTQASKKAPAKKAPAKAAKKSPAKKTAKASKKAPAKAAKKSPAKKTAKAPKKTAAKKTPKKAPAKKVSKKAAGKKASAKKAPAKKAPAKKSKRPSRK